MKFLGSRGHQNIHHGRHMLTRTKEWFEILYVKILFSLVDCCCYLSVSHCMKYLVHTQVVIIFILVVLGILCIYLLYLFIDSKRRPVELSVTADEVTRFNVIKYILHL